MNVYIIATVLPLCAYLAGAIPFGLLIVRWVTRTDIREIGSRNIGATNVKRAAGTRWAVVTLICDVLKGLLPTLAAASLLDSTWHWLPAVTALAAVVGHMYPVYLGFQPSGKGVATTIGGLIAIAPMAGLFFISAFILTVYFSHRVSVGSATATVTLPPATWFSTHDPAVTIAVLFIMVLILLRHKENFQRLAAGTEPRLGKK